MSLSLARETYRGLPKVRSSKRKQPRAAASSRRIGDLVMCLYKQHVQLYVGQYQRTPTMPEYASMYEAAEAEAQAIIKRES